jgi:hypothetical protein
VIDILSTEHFLRGSHCLLLRPKIQYKLEALRKLGYTVLAVPFWEWRSCRTLEARVGFLSDRLGVDLHGGGATEVRHAGIGSKFQAADSSGNTRGWDEAGTGAAAGGTGARPRPPQFRFDPWVASKRGVLAGSRSGEGGRGGGAEAAAWARTGARSQFAAGTGRTELGWRSASGASPMRPSVQILQPEEGQGKANSEAEAEPPRSVRPRRLRRAALRAAGKLR